MDKDLYEILMVHPRAEAFLIHAAYRRLVREYHPDVYKAVDAHERMVEINAAYDVLSDAERRRTYDATVASAASSRPAPTRRDTAPAGPVATTEQPSPRAARGPGGATGGSAPVPPDALSYGIDSAYADRAMAGAREWRARAPVVSPRAAAMWVWCWAAGGLALSVEAWLHRVRGVEDFGLALPILAAVLGYAPVAAAQSLRDSRQLRSEYLPRYNPNPDGYLKYARAYAEYLTALRAVYVSRSWIMHSDPACCGMQSYLELPKWDAEGRGARPCSHCGWFAVRPLQLPHPFGPAPVDDEPPRSG